VTFFRVSLLSIAFAWAGLCQAPAAAPAPAPKIALVNIQDAIVGTSDGHTAEKELAAEFEPRKAQLDEKRNALEALKDKVQDEKLTSGQREKLIKEVNDKTILLNLETDKDDSDLEAAQKKVLAELGKKMVTVIADFAIHEGYAVVFDVSTSQAPLLYADNATDITREVIAAYESKFKK
jgi:Skp family chaperone for outer membrane proteins